MSKSMLNGTPLLLLYEMSFQFVSDRMLPNKRGGTHLLVAVGLKQLLFLIEAFQIHSLVSQDNIHSATDQWKRRAPAVIQENGSSS